MKRFMAACFLDANIFIGYLIPNNIFHSYCQSLIEKLLKNHDYIHLSPLVIDEVMYAIYKDSIIFSKLTRTESIENVEQATEVILKLPNIKLVNPPLTIQGQLLVISLMKQFDLRPRDAYHLLTITHHKIKYFATLDHDFDLVFSKTSLKQFSGN
jgi:predicted nucleic acid-binding protein